MRVWLITVGEPLPLPGKSDRLHRTGMLAAALRERGHEVLWWTSSFDHFNKAQLVQETTTVTLDNRYRLRLLKAPGYRRNVSLQRVRDHRSLGRAFADLAPAEPAPDVILCSLPTLELPLEATRYGRQYGVPVVIDIRDLWPDVFVDAFPHPTRAIGRLMLAPFYQMARVACRAATAVIGTSEPYVNWGLRLAGRVASPYDREFPLAYRADPPAPEELAWADECWAGRGITADAGRFVACYFGAFGQHAEIKTVLQAAAMLPQVTFVLCGSGDRLNHFRKSAQGMRNVLLPGWVGSAEIWTLLRLSSLGLAPYRNTGNYAANIPNKPVEYLSAALPVISSLEGVVEDLLRTNECGITYRNADPEGLAQVIRQLFDAPDYRRKLSANAGRVFRERFTAEAVCGRMVDHLEALVASQVLRYD